MAESERMTAEKVVGCLLVRDGPDPSARVGDVGVPAADGDPRLAPLSERERDIVHLVALGYTHQEIAATLRIPVGTSKSRLSVARRRLSRTFDAS